MSCNMKNGNSGVCCPTNSYWNGKCADGSDPYYYGSGCSNYLPCCPMSVGCPKGAPGPALSPVVPKACKSVCSSSSNLMSTDSSPTIKGISISDNNLIINYGGGSKPSTPPVNPWPMNYGSNVMWLYACPNKQGLACLPTKYTTPSGMKQFVSDIISSHVNFISLICNNSFKKPEDLGLLVPASSGSFEATSAIHYPSTFTPCCDTKGSMQTQTTIAFTKEQLKELHSAGITIVMSIGSWMSDFPREKDGSASWTSDDFDKFVNIFECMRCSLDYSLDGIDFDIEGTCNSSCLWGQQCGCGWDKGCSGNGGMKTYDQSNKQTCYILPDQGTVNVMNGIAERMHAKKYVCTTVPPTNVMFSGDKDASDKYNGQNQFVKYNLNMEYFDGVMFQFYTGFDAGMCGDNWENCMEKKNVTDLSKIDLSKYISAKPGEGITDSYKNLPSYPNWPNRNPVHCPRSIDCPDWAYEGEKAFQTQVEYFKSILTIPGMKASKIALGLEFYFDTSQWGPFPSPTLFYGLNKELENQIGSTLGGIGGWTIAGTFGEYSYPNEPPKIGGGTCDCDQTENGGIKNNMWCAGAYYEHFEKAITTCWGKWGKNDNKGVSKPTAVCSDIPLNKYCVGGKLQCIEVVDEEHKCPGPLSPENEWPPRPRPML